MRIHYVERGSGLPVVLVHGFTGSLNTWNQFGVFDNLAKSYRVIALDARGHGLSDKPHKPSDYGPEMALDIITVMDHLKVQKAHIIGYSMGGSLVAELLTLRDGKQRSLLTRPRTGLLLPLPCDHLRLL